MGARRQRGWTWLQVNQLQCRILQRNAGNWQEVAAVGLATPHPRAAPELVMEKQPFPR